MNIEAQNTENQITTQEPTNVPEKSIPRRPVILFNGSTRYYGYRNTRRATALRWLTALFILTGVLGFLLMVVGIGTAAVWFILFILTLSLITRYNNAWFTFIKNCFLGGVLFIVGSIVLRFLVELIFSGFELLELKTNPDGAEKYLKVRRATFKISCTNLALCAVIAGAGWLAYTAGIGKNAETIIFIVAAVVAFIISRIVLQRVYRKVSNEIIEIRKERLAVKK